MKANNNLGGNWSSSQYHIGYDFARRTRTIKFEHFCFVIYLHAMTFLPPVNEVWGKAICLQVCVWTQGVGRGCYPSMHCRWYPSMPCNRSWWGLQAHTQGGCGGGSGPGPQPRGSWGGSGPGPHPRGKLREICPGGLVPSLGGCLVPGALVLGGAWSKWCLVEMPLDGYCCGQYASYLNAFLFALVVSGEFLLPSSAHKIYQSTRQHSSKMRTTLMPTVSVSVATTRCQ